MMIHSLDFRKAALGNGAAVCADSFEDSFMFFSFSSFLGFPRGVPTSHGMWD